MRDRDEIEKEFRATNWLDGVGQERHPNERLKESITLEALLDIRDQLILLNRQLSANNYRVPDPPKVKV